MSVHPSSVKPYKGLGMEGAVAKLVRVPYKKIA